MVWCQWRERKGMVANAGRFVKSGGRELREILYDGFSLFMCTIQEVSVYAHNKEMEEEGLMLIMEAEQLGDFRRVKKIWNSCGKREQPELENLVRLLGTALSQVEFVSMNSQWCHLSLGSGEEDHWVYLELEAFQTNAANRQRVKGVRILARQ